MSGLAGDDDPEPPGAMTRPNSSRTNATPTRSTAMIASGEACAGESPAVCTTCTTPQSAGRIGEGSDRVMGGDIDGRGGRVEAGRLQRIRGGRGGGLIDVAQQDRLAYADPAGNC